MTLRSLPRPDLSGPGPLFALALAWVSACAEPPPRPRPVEVPIGEYAVGTLRLPPPRGAGPQGGGAASSPSGAKASDRPPDKGAECDPTAATGESPRASGAESGPSRELDLKGGFLGATFGSSPKAHRGLVQFEKRGEAVVYRAPERSYGGYALRDVTYVFKRNQLSTILFAVKSPNDCKPIRETLARELGAPERVVGETSLWRGERVGLRFTVRGSGTCSAVVQSKELDRAEWDAL